MTTVIWDNKKWIITSVVCD